jgi:hypothetical protein
MTYGPSDSHASTPPVAILANGSNEATVETATAQSLRKLPVLLSQTFLATLPTAPSSTSGVNASDPPPSTAFDCSQDILPTLVVKRWFDRACCLLRVIRTEAP